MADKIRLTKTGITAPMFCEPAAVDYWVNERGWVIDPSDQTPPPPGSQPVTHDELDAFGLADLADVTTAGGAVGKFLAAETVSGGALTGAGLRWLPGQAPGLAFARAAFASRDAGPRPVVFAGDSNFEGFNGGALKLVDLLSAMLQAAYPLASGDASPGVRTLAQAATASFTAGVQGINAGFGGQTAATYLDTTRRGQIATVNPNVVIHWVGSNDFRQGVAVATYKANVQTQLDALKTGITNQCVHILVHSQQRYDTFTPVATWAEYGKALREIADADTTGRTVFIDLSWQFAAAGIPSTDPLDLLLSDNIHLNDSGNRFAADALRDAMGLPAALNVARDVTAPATPTSLDGSTTSTAVTLTWTAATDNYGIAGYRIHRDGQYLASTTATTFTDTGLTTGTAYSYRVTARDFAGNESRPTAPLVATPGTGVALPGTNPAVVPGLYTLLRADDLALADNTAVASWTPTAGSETGVAVQATAGSQPVLRTAQLNGRKAVTFDAANNQHIGTPTWTSIKSQPFTQFAVFRITNRGGRFITWGGTVGDGIFSLMGIEGAGKLFADAGNYAGIVSPSAIDTGAWHIAAMVYDNTTSRLYLDSKTAIAGSTSQGNASGARMTRLLIGGNSQIASAITGSVAEVSVIAGAMTNTDVGSVLDHLAARYGLTVAA